MATQATMGVALARVWAGGVARLRRGTPSAGAAMARMRGLARVAKAAVAPIAPRRVARSARFAFRTAAEPYATAPRHSPVARAGAALGSLPTQHRVAADIRARILYYPTLPGAIKAAGKLVASAAIARGGGARAAITASPIILSRMVRAPGQRAGAPPHAAMGAAKRLTTRRLPQRAAATVKPATPGFAPGAGNTAIIRRRPIAPAETSSVASPVLQNAGHRAGAPAAPAPAPDPIQFGRWISDQLADAAMRPPSGISGPDDRLTPVFAGMIGPS